MKTGAAKRNKKIKEGYLAYFLVSVIFVDAKASISSIKVQMELRTKVTAQLPLEMLKDFEVCSGYDDLRG